VEIGKLEPEGVEIVVLVGVEEDWVYERGWCILQTSLTGSRSLNGTTMWSIASRIWAV
jgi:hypothetical protein